MGKQEKGCGRVGGLLPSQDGGGANEEQRSQEAGGGDFELLGGGPAGQAEQGHLQEEQQGQTQLQGWRKVGIGIARALYPRGARGVKLKRGN